MNKVMVLMLGFGLFWQVSATGQELAHLNGLNDSSYRTFTVKDEAHSYHIYVRVPPGVDQTTKKLPTVYLLDGGNTFPMLTPYAKYLSFNNAMDPVILVGVGYGTDDWEQGNRRGTDYTLPADSREYYGGADKFHQFLKEDLIPWVEKNYPADPAQRLLFGHSLGGQFALYCAMFQPDTFGGLIASNPAIHRNTALFTDGFKTGEQSPNLFVMQADGDNTEYQQARATWYAHWQNKPHPWTLKVMDAKGHNHMSSVPSAFRQGLLWLLNKSNTEPNHEQ